jgi:hypothetical protein
VLRDFLFYYAVKMTNNTSTPWNHTDISTLTFTNCTAVSRIVIDIFRDRDLPLGVTTRLLREGLSPYLKPNEEPTVVQLFEWFSNYGNGTTIAIWNSVPGCLETLCPMIGWQGNADLAGRGVSVN